jgi:hypothetical protein
MPMSKKRFERKLQKRREMDATVVAIDQTKKSVQVEPRATWFPRGTRPSVELSGQRDWTCLLGAITEDGDRFSPIRRVHHRRTRETFYFVVMK